MPRIHRADIRGMSLQQLKDLLLAAIQDGTYLAGDIQKVINKIEKRILDGHRLVDDDVEQEIVKLSGGFE